MRKIVRNQVGVTNGSGERSMSETTDYVLTEKGLRITSERYWREKIADEIRSLDLKSEARQISSDWLGATVRTQMACAAVAEKGIDQ